MSGPATNKNPRENNTVASKYGILVFILFSPLLAE
jgi:hypothetical protein